MKLTATLLLCCLSMQLSAQTDTEFPREFIMHLKLHNGMVTNFTNAPDQYAGGLQLVPQYTLVTNRLRGGLILDGFYTGKKIQGAAGATLSFKLKTIRLAPFGSGGNIHLNLDHLWGTGHQRLLGAGINLDLGNLVVLGLTAHRDYRLAAWWFQSSIGVRISHAKKLTEL